MGKSTKIPWCDSTWSPVTGCRHGCSYCYAAQIARRFAGSIRENLTACEEYGETGSGLYVLDEPFHDETGAHRTYPFGFAPTLHRYRLDEPQKLNGRTIFVGSMCDLFGDWVPDEWIELVFRSCREASQHTYLFLTKNPKRLCNLANDGKLPKEDNFWWGSTLDNKEALRFDGGFAYNTFLSIEPLTEYMDVGLGSFGSARWIIIGAETGNRREKVTPERSWIRNIEDAAAITRAPVFMKDSLIPIVGEENMRREFPDGLRVERSTVRTRCTCMNCGEPGIKKKMVTINGKMGRDGAAYTIGQMCRTCAEKWCSEMGFSIPEEWRTSYGEKEKLPQDG